jgi:phospholipase/lecithinase/hemolysin
LFTASLPRSRTKQFGNLSLPGLPVNVARSRSRLQRLIKAGATHLVVPGNLPMGCSSAYLTLHPGRNGSDYDAAGCLRTYNDFAQHHNAVLQRKLRALRAKYPQARIMYADYYGAAMSFAKNPKQFGECDRPTAPFPHES